MDDRPEESADEREQKFLREFGMSKDEAIESDVVSRRIRQAQQKIEGRAFGTVNAGSAAEWLEKNCPDLGPK